MPEIDNSLKEIQEAKKLLKVTRESEKEQRDASIDYDEKHVRQSIIHTREDIILLVSLMGNLLAQSKKINKRLFVVIVVLILCFILIFFKL
jgi:hypothetical protein